MTNTSVQNVDLQEVRVIKVSLDYSFPIQPNDSAEAKDFTQLEAERAYPDLVALQRAALRQLL